MSDLNNRRPLESRNTNWAKRCAGFLAARAITPNQISQASIGAALIAGGAFWMTGLTTNVILTGGLLVLSALACQLRLLCNLFDGMVAIEAGKSAPDGPFWNEYPDRIADILIFAGVGLGVGSPALGFAAATMAVLTAYTRELGTSIGLSPNFSGPMAKQHRMALITGAAFLAMFEPLLLTPGTILTIALWAVVVGAIATSVRRAYDIRKSLLQGKSS
ncbi:CDP-alcohol phosphatidyltransferase family protein [Sedimentitalea todarodis]|uniref:CDP-alcohol phosphatidyltransferase family protein n=1 Tax=Sedimentitalea todarodis TaxID=1631240 RepID=A0ABU3VE42_9RHOB|nr:CDP-alcohol phosphatidyltransferase family protein [Sedimentitalea todarodis]MDU9004445.1 CDP-alcohol phosphatidyltransferase family protein [Sedimentitalea todarodis]